MKQNLESDVNPPAINPADLEKAKQGILVLLGLHPNPHVGYLADFHFKKTLKQRNIFILVPGKSDGEEIPNPFHVTSADAIDGALKKLSEEGLLKKRKDEIGGQYRLSDAGKRYVKKMLHDPHLAGALGLDVPGSNGKASDRKANLMNDSAAPEQEKPVEFHTGDAKAFIIQNIRKNHPKAMAEYKKAMVKYATLSEDARAQKPAPKEPKPLDENRIGVEAGILHLMAVRHLRHLADNKEDKQMHKEKLVRRLLSKDIKAYLLDPAVAFEKETLVPNPYAQTDITEAQWKALESIKMLSDAINGAVGNQAGNHLQRVRESLAQINDATFATIQEAFGVRDKSLVEDSVRVMRENVAEIRRDLEQNTITPKDYISTIPLNDAVRSIEELFASETKMIKDAISEQAKTAAFAEDMLGQKKVENLAKLPPKIGALIHIANDNQCRITDLGLQLALPENRTIDPTRRWHGTPDTNGAQRR